MNPPPVSASPHNPQAFLGLLRNPLSFRLYLLKNLPAALFSGLRVRQVGPDACTVSVPFTWFTKNPFRSTYFACLSMAAELSTGVLAMAQVYNRRPAVSMLITGIEGAFLKKAVGITMFTCEEGGRIAQAVETALLTGVPQTVKVCSTGRNAAGETVAEFWLTWSFKPR